MSFRSRAPSGGIVASEGGGKNPTQGWGVRVGAPQRQRRARTPASLCHTPWRFAVFDLRYHFVSLVAVFFALIIGILVGVGIADRGVVEDSLRRQLRNVEAELSDERRRSAFLERQQERTQDYIDDSYEALMHRRLAGKRVALVYVGSIDAEIARSVEQTVDDAGGRLARMRALRLPIDRRALTASLSALPEPARYAGGDGLVDLGRDLARELVDGGDTPLWDAAGARLVEEQVGGLERPVDAVVVTRTARPQRGPTGGFLRGFYAGLADSGVPAVGVETSDSHTTAIGLYRRRGLSSVDDVERASGRLALALLLAGGEQGQYGLRSDDGLTPPIEPLAEPVD